MSEKLTAHEQLIPVIRPDVELGGPNVPTHDSYGEKLGGDEQIDAIFDRMSVEQPHLVQILEVYIGAIARDGEERIKMQETAAITYRAIENQLEHEAKSRREQ